MNTERGSYVDSTDSHRESESEAPSALSPQVTAMPGALLRRQVSPAADFAIEAVVSSRANLDHLIDPSRFLEPLEIESADPALLARMLRDMRLIRLTEERIGDLVEREVIRTPCHLGIGQEAVAVGVSAHLRASDRVFGGHRSHSHYLAMGGGVYQLFAEVLGRADGASRGMGGSMHLCARAVGFQGSVPLVGATIPIAVGAALAAKKQGSGDVGVAYFGDGATEEGVLHESLNLAALYGLPVVFVCENNLFSSHLDISLRQPSDRVARFAEAHRVTAYTVDGNDVMAVANAARKLIGRARAGQGPGFLEAVTYRHRGHVGYMDDIDVGVRRKMEDLVAWKRRDPIRRLEQAMLAAHLISLSESERQQDELRAEVQRACERALAARYPSPGALLGAVFRKGATP